MLAPMTQTCITGAKICTNQLILHPAEQQEDLIDKCLYRLELLRRQALQPLSKVRHIIHIPIAENQDKILKNHCKM